MRIRRYAARLLASQAPASAPAPPLPDAAAAAPWLHAAADDCAFCDLTRRSDPQVSPDRIKHKGHIHIAGLETGGELLKSDDLAQRPPVPEAQRCKIVHEHSASEDAAVLEVTEEAEPQVASDGIKHTGQEPKGELKSDEHADLPQRPHTPTELIPAQRCETDYEHSTSKDVAGLEVTAGRADAKPECTNETTIVSEEATEAAVKGGDFVVDEATDEQEAARTSPPVNESVIEFEPEATGGVSLASGSIADPEITTGTSRADEDVAEREVSEGVSIASEAATEQADAVTASGVRTGAHLDDKGVAEPDIKMEASPVDESTAEMDIMQIDSFASEAATHPGLPEKDSLANENARQQEVSEGVSPASEASTEPADVVAALEITTGAPLDAKSNADRDIEMGASSVNESAAEMDFTPLGSLVIQAATHPGLPERVSPDNENATEQEVSEGVLLVRETSTESANVVTAVEVATGAPLDNEGIAEPHIKMGASPVYESSAEMDVDVEAAADLGLPERVSLANRTATERDLSEEVSVVNEAAAEPADVVTASEVTAGAPLDNERAAEPETKMGASLVNESTAEMDCGQLGSVVIEATTLPGLAERVSLVSEVVTESGTANFDAEVSLEPEATGGPSLLNESTDLEITEGVSISKEAAAGEVTGKASACSEDEDAALNETQPLDCGMDCATVQIENAGVSVANDVQPSRDDAADEVVSVRSTSTGPVRDKSQAADEVTPHDDTPSVSCVSGIVARSVGKSGRTDIICYARRGGKRKLDMTDMKTEQTGMDDSDIIDQSEEKAALDRTAPCESAMSTAGSADIKLADIKRGLAGESASSKCKRRRGRYECDIDYCRMTFKKKTELCVHKKNMCTVRSCGKHFRSHKYLKRHQTTHNDDTPYKCPWEDCNMAFKWTWSLADHFRVHTGEKPYRCKTPGCSKIYKYVSDFIRHKKRCKPQR